MGVLSTLTDGSETLINRHVINGTVASKMSTPNS